MEQVKIYTKNGNSYFQENSDMTKKQAEETLAKRDTITLSGENNVIVVKVSEIESIVLTREE